MSIDALVQFRRLHLISGHASRARLGGDAGMLPAPREKPAGPVLKC
jgi:hypothetical protein